MRTLKQALLCCAIVMAASQASASIIHFDAPAGPLGNSVTKDGVTITNSATGPNAYVSLPDGTVLATSAGASNTVTAGKGKTITLSGIDLENGDGSPSNYIVSFTFNYADGTVGGVSEQYAPIGGLENFQFNPLTYTNLTSFVFTPLGFDPSPDSRVAFNNLDVSITASVSAVPLPASLPMFGAALLALGGVGYGLNRRAGQKNGIATAA